MKTIRRTAKPLPLVAALVVGALLQGCSAREDLSHLIRVHTELRSTFGVDAHVNERTVNGVTTVRVTLAALPEGDTNATRRAVEGIVRRGVPRAHDVQVYSRL